MGAAPQTHASGAGLLATRSARPSGQPYTYANIGVLAPRLFPWLYAAVQSGRVSAQLWQGRWWNVGTPQELATVDQILR